MRVLVVLTLVGTVGCLDWDAAGAKAARCRVAPSDDGCADAGGDGGAAVVAQQGGGACLDAGPVDGLRAEGAELEDLRAGVVEGGGGGRVGAAGVAGEGGEILGELGVPGG